MIAELSPRSFTCSNVVAAGRTDLLNTAHRRPSIIDGTGGAAGASGRASNRIRAALRERGTIPMIPGRRNRKRSIQYDDRSYKDRWRVEAMFCRLKDFRRIATRYDKLARNFL